MARKRVDYKDKIFAYATCITGTQLDWISEHPEFKIHKFIRNQIDKYMELKKEVNEFNEKTTE